jgi:hypothetical protein
MKVLRYIPGDKPELKRFDGKCPHYEDQTQLWILCNVVVMSYVVKYKGKIYKITYTFLPGLITDKASTPAVKSDWYGGDPHYLPHDVNFSCHCLEMFSINDDDGFRASNIVFEGGIEANIEYAYKHKKINRFKKILWSIKKRIWYRSVGSIVGQGLYVNGSPDRGYHGKYSRCEIKEV